MAIKEFFDHPCKQTCSGWKQGFDKGFEVATEYQHALAEAKKEIENLKMVCRRLAAAKTLSSKDKIAKQCFELFKGNILRTAQD